MAFVQVAFGPNPMAKVGPFGLKLPTLVGTYSLDETSCFEPPMSVEARVDTPTAIEVGAFTSIATAGKIGNVKVGRYCAIAPEVKIGAHEHPTDWLTCSRVTYYPEIHNWDQFCKPDQVDTIRRQRRPFANSCPITTLGHDVWIGQGAFIRSGVTLGTGCIVAAKSVVVKDVPPYAIVAGMPARIKRYRFANQTIERLLKIQWWRYSLYDLSGVPFERVDEALDQIEERLASGALKEYQPKRYAAKDLKELCNGAQ